MIIQIYKYVNYEINSSYCASLHRNIEEVTAELTNLYRDNLIFYSNYTLNHKDQYKEIGLNYEDPEYYKDYNCVKPISERQYSTYLYNSCGKFSKDKKQCFFEKNTDYFTQFYQDFHDYYSTGYCSKKYKDKKCIEYYSVMGNPQMIRPLFQDLKKYLILGQSTDEDEDEEITTENDEEVEVTDYWIKQCIDLPEVIVNITTPSNYQNAIYLKYTLFYIILIIFIIY